MTVDSTAVRISLYFTMLWLAGGMVGLLHHFHSMTPMHIGAAVVLTILTVSGFVAVTYTRIAPLKLLAEPFTAGGVLVAGVGYFFNPYSVLALIVGAIILGAFGVSLYEEKQDRARK